MTTRTLVALVWATLASVACGASPNVSPSAAQAPKPEATRTKAGATKDESVTPGLKYVDLPIEQVFTDPKRLEKMRAAFPKIDAAVAQTQQELGLPGLAVGIIVDGQLEHVAAAGHADTAGKRPITEDTVFRVGSITKTLTAAAILELRDDGKLSLDDPVAKHVPELANVLYPSKDSAPITLRQLLSHSSGLPRDVVHATPTTETVKGTSTEELLESLDGVALEFAPGTHSKYSNLGFAVLGVVVERVARVPYRTYMAKRLFEPLGLKSAAWSRQAVPSNQLAVSYVTGNSGSRTPAKHERLGMADPSGGLYLSVRDLARWVGFNMDAYPARSERDAGPLKRASLREMHVSTAGIMLGVSPPFSTPESRMAEPWASSVGLGWNESVLCDHDRLVEKGGLVEYFQSESGFFPDEGIGIVVLANGGWDRHLKQRAFFDVLRLLRESGGISKRVASVPEVPTLERAFSRLLDVMNSWDETKYQAMLTSKHREAVPTASEKSELAGYSALHGRCTSGKISEFASVDHAQFSVDCERGQFELWIQLRDGLIDGFWGASKDVKADLRVQAAAKAALAALASKRMAGQAKLFAQPLSSEAQLAARAERHKREHGTCALGKLKVRDGNGWHRFELSCHKGRTVALKIKLNPAGKIDGFDIQRDAEGTCDPALLSADRKSR